MDYHEFMHSGDAAAIDKLKHIPLLDKALNLVMKFGVEEYCRGMFLANHIRLSPRQLPRVYNLLPPICETLGVDIPELYLGLDPQPNAFTVGNKRNFIVITSGLLDALADEEEIRVVLAHECGHVACRHVFYSTMIQAMFNLASQNTVLAGMMVALRSSLSLAFNAWLRMSELSADRAASVCLGEIVTPIRTLLRLSGGSAKCMKDINLDEYAEQMMESEGMQAGSKWQNMLREFVEMDEEHPYTVTRIKELMCWGRDLKFQTIIKQQTVS